MRASGPLRSFTVPSGTERSYHSVVSADEELLRAWRDGDKGAGDQLFDRYVEPLTRFFVKRGHARQDADDLAQRTFVAATEGLARFRGTASARTWLFAIAHNVLRQWSRELRRQSAREVGLGDKTRPSAGAGLHTMLTDKRDRRVLLEALRRLDLESQLVLQLRYWDGVTADEIAEILGCTVHGARNRLRKAKRELLAIFDCFAREQPEVESTITSLEDWAKALRADWVGE